MTRNPDIYKSEDEVIPEREAPDVFNAFGAGMVFCRRCNGVHIDFIDETETVKATALLNMDQWDEIVAQIEAERRTM